MRIGPGQRIGNRRYSLILIYDRPEATTFARFLQLHTPCKKHFSSSQAVKSQYGGVGVGGGVSPLLTDWFSVPPESSPFRLPLNPLTTATQSGKNGSLKEISALGAARCLTCSWRCRRLHHICCEAAFIKWKQVLSLR